MASQREILEHILRMAEAASDDDFNYDSVQIEGGNTRSVPTFYIRLYLDPWMRNKTRIQEVYKVVNGRWKNVTGDSMARFIDLPELTKCKLYSGKNVFLKELLKHIAEP